ncbi:MULTISPECIES: LacI family DNA-binding transcriptional regulator [unclassified Cytobacillus]|uniref:LacI family DNA-binding transcriptional regulator n=1 Tax=unclassified Cytobacillus TaxID=2675268 RepID=UPI00135B3F36|nr:LacI family DNA-binding transcriptional regulator [Cytobacillus sp. AMY 15.2]KAF0819185.1 Transcriptional regulator, LacI/PurR family [Bacillus sp. ZZV12-4809]MCM3091847.1 LacI family transcriptional regulator [Cytobacillus sp. AMY 15.2]
MITIKEIAERAKVSRTTVSRVLNNSGYVSEDARKRVLHVIEETGYVPSAHAKSLRTKKTKVIGVILPKISTETSSRLVNGIDEVLAGEGYQILLANTNLHAEKEIEYIRLLKSRNVDGMILSATNVEPELIQEIRQLNIPFIMVGQHAEELTSVIFDEYQAARDMAGLLIRKGYKKIAFIGVDEADRAVGYLRKQGYLDAMKEHQLSVESAWLQKGIFDIDSGFNGMKNIMESAEDKPQAVVAVTDRLAIGALRYLRQNGYSVPGDVAIAGMGGSELSKYITPALTTIDFSFEDAGREAALLILQKINGEHSLEKTRKINYRLVERESI